MKIHLAKAIQVIKDFEKSGKIFKKVIDKEKQIWYPLIVVSENKMPIQSECKNVNDVERIELVD